MVDAHARWLSNRHPMAQVRDIKSEPAAGLPFASRSWLALGHRGDARAARGTGRCDRPGTRFAYAKPGWAKREPEHWGRSPLGTSSPSTRTGEAVRPVLGAALRPSPSTRASYQSAASANSSAASGSRTSTTTCAEPLFCSCDSLVSGDGLHAPGSKVLQPLCHDLGPRLLGSFIGRTIEALEKAQRNLRALPFGESKSSL